MFKNIQYVYFLNKYTKCNIWRLAVRYDIYIYIYIYIYRYVIRRLKVKLQFFLNRVNFFRQKFSDSRMFRLSGTQLLASHYVSVPSGK